MVVEAAVFPGVGEGKTLEREVAASGTHYHPAFPLHYEAINGTNQGDRTVNALTSD